MAKPNPLLKKAVVKPTVGPDGKLRRPGAPQPNTEPEVDMEAMEAKAKMEITQKTKIGNLAKLAAADDGPEADAPLGPMKKTAAQGKEQLPSLDAKASTEASAPKKDLSPEEQAAALEDMKKTRAIARAQAREQRLNAASAGVPLPSTEGRKGEWYYIHENQAVGPILAEELKDKLNDPTMKPPLKMIWTGGMERWMPVYECPQLWQELNEAGV